MYCTSCGKKRNSKDKYCTSCGKKFEDVNLEESSRESGPKITSYPSEVPVILTGVLSLVFLLVPFISIPLAIISICLGIAYQRKRHKFSVGSVLGIITIIITVLLFLSTLFVVPLVKVITNSVEDNFPEIEDREDSEVSEFDITNYRWQGNDKSILSFENEQFVWQKSDQTSLEGKYQIYTGMDVINFITSHLDEFGWSSSESEDYFKKGSSALENYYLIVLSSNSEKIYFIGTLNDRKTSLTLEDIQSKKEIIFTLKEKIGSIDV